MPSDTTPNETSLAAAALSRRSWELTPDRSARTATPRAALEQRFLDEAGGDPEVAQHIRKAYYLRLSAHALRARRAAGSKAVGE